MTRLLQLETATSVCSVCITENGVVIGLEESHEKNSHASVLHVFIDRLLKKFQLPYSAIDAIVVSMGPGSYTGLRIGVAAAKGFGFALDKPVIAINTLESMTAHFQNHYRETREKKNVLFCPMIDARRQEVYTSCYNREGNEVSPTQALILTADSFHKELEDHSICFFGDGSEKFKDLISRHPNAFFYEHFKASSEGLTIPALRAYKTGKFIDLAYFEPFYLKDFVPGVPKAQ